MKSSNLLRVAFTALALAVTACSSTPAKDTGKDKSAKDKPLTPANPFRPDSVTDLAARERKLGAEGLYRQARLALDSSDFSTAISRYSQIAARFPFTEYATQADLERVYALYRSFQPDDSLTAADKFLKEHPRHPAADYVQYIKGLVNTSRDEGLSGTLGLDNTKEDISFLRRAFDDFSLLAQKYPTSIYAGDARQHMIDLRNRIARHDLHVVHYYVKRGAFIAAAKRAEQILLQYPGAPVTIEAMQILETCYTQMGLTDQAAQVHKLLLAQLAMPTPQTDYPVGPKKPGFFEGLMGSSKSKSAPAPAAYVAPAAVVTSTPEKAATPAPEDAPTFSNWFKRLFSPGNEALEGAVIVVPVQGGNSPDNADTATPAPAAGSDATSSNSNGIHGNGFSVTMEPYDEGESKKSADKPATATAAPVAAPASTPVAPAAKDPSEEPTFMNWLRHVFSSDKKPAEAAPAASKPATDSSKSTKSDDENRTPTLMDLLYHSVVPDKKDADSTTPADSKDSKPTTTP